jgi:hypothetical protein
MKKLAILILLTAVLAASAFAIEGIGNITVGGTIELHTINEEDHGGTNATTGATSKGRSLAFTPKVTFSRDLIERLNLFVGLNSSIGIREDQHTIDIPFYEDGKISAALKQIDLVLSYSLAAGPGTLGFALRNRSGVVLVGDDSPTDYSFWGNPKDTFNNATRLRVSYKFKAGPGNLTLGAYTGFSFQPNRKREFDYDNLGFDFSYSVNGFTLATDNAISGLTLESASRNLKYGRNWWQLGYSDDVLGIGFEGVGVSGRYAVKPYVELHNLVKNLNLGVYVKFETSGNATNSIGDVSPGVYAFYSF